MNAGAGGRPLALPARHAARRVGPHQRHAPGVPALPDVLADPGPWWRPTCSSSAPSTPSTRRAPRRGPARPRTAASSCSGTARRAAGARRGPARSALDLGARLCRPGSRRRPRPRGLARPRARGGATAGALAARPSAPRAPRRAPRQAPRRQPGSAGAGWDESRLARRQALPEPRVARRRRRRRTRSRSSAVDGHAPWVNAAALALAGLHAATADPAGGRVILRDRAAAHRRPRRRRPGASCCLRSPRPSVDELMRLIADGLADLARLGLTAVHDAGCTSSVLRAYAGSPTPTRFRCASTR